MEAASASMGLQKPAKKRKSQILEILRDSVRTPTAKIGAILLIVMILACIAAPLIAPYGVNDMDFSSPHSAPSAKHIMGTDNVGRDQFTRLLYGGRYSLAIGFVGSIFSTLLAIILGCIAGYFGGAVESLIMRAMDVLSSLPSILLAIMISTALGSGFFNTVIALSISQVPSFTRMMRAQVLTERSQEYIEAAELINCSKLRVMFRHILPNAISPMIICLTLGVGENISTAASLSFIGLGIQPPTPEWGALLASSRTHMINYPYLVVFPGLFIAMTILAANFIGDGLRDALDPKLRK